MPEIQDSHGNKVVLGDITGYDKVVLLKLETEVALSYGVYTEVDGQENSYYQHFISPFFGKGVPECELNALEATLIWVRNLNLDCEIEIR